MSDRMEVRLRRRESLVTYVFTLFSVFLAYVTVMQSWPALFVVVIIAELFYAWWAYITRFQDHHFRAVILTLLSCGSITFYGMHAVDYVAIIPTLCVFAIMVVTYQIRLLLDIVALDCLLLGLYHLLVKKTFPDISDHLQLERLMLQLLSFVMLFLLCAFQIRRNHYDDEDLEETERQMQRTQKIKDDFVANTSHELRTPITTVTGMSELLLAEDLPESAHRKVMDIQMTSIELQGIVTDILDYASLEAGTLTLNPRAYNITSTINDVMNTTVFQNGEKDLELIFDCDPSIPCLLYGDEQQLRRVINNLIGNAIKFTQKGGVTVSIGYRREDYGVNLIVTVKDTGIGLTQAEQERIFQSFYQADADRNRAEEGMGLGLTISSLIVRKMGGFLTVHSTRGKGSLFSFAVPQKVMDERPCIALTHPNMVNAIWYFNEENSSQVIRDDYIGHIEHVSEHLGIYMHRASTLRELKRRVSQTSYSHLLIGLAEYREDPAFFDGLARTVSTILIVGRRDQIPTSGRMHILYKPYNAMTLAEIFNGGDLMEGPMVHLSQQHFEAPEAKVLVVDDNIMNIKVVEGLLAKYHIRITPATSGDEALAQIQSQDVDFVFMDHMMPGMDGIECMHKIRALRGSYFQQVPIIALTANAIAGSREMFLSEGFDDFVAKPIDISLLDQVLHKYIPDHKKQAPSEQKAAQELQDVISEDEAAEAPAAPVSSVVAEGASDPLTRMEGIDLATALSYCGSEADFIELAQFYCEQAPANVEKIQDAYDASDWGNYAILVHALKSTSRTVGAIKLSELAYTQEKAGKEGDAETIRAWHAPLMEEYRRVVSVFGANPMIAPAGGTAEVERLVSLDQTEWEEIRTRLKELIETFEGDAVEEYVRRNAGRSYKGQGLGELFAPLVACVQAFDFDGAQKELEKAGGEQA